MKKINLKVPVSVIKEGQTFIVYCSLLDVTGVGKTQKQAEKRFQEAVEIFFEETAGRGTLHEVLQDLGWQKVNKTWSPPEEISHKKEEIQIPLSA